MARRVAVAALLLPFLLLLAIPAVHAQTPKRGGVIRIAEREAPGLDPHLTISFLSHSYVSLSYSQLVRFPNGPEQKSPTDFSILPDLAEKWTVSKDGKVYTFFLRKGVKFHNKPPVNGREMVAEDVKYSLERFMAKSGFATRFEPVAAIVAVDKHTGRLTLKEPYAPFLNHLANPSFCVILPREAEEKYKDFNHPDAVIGTGPFVLKSYEKGVRVVFERNPDYFMKGFPYLDGAVIEITPDAAARVAVLRAGKADLPHIWGGVSPEEARALQKTNPELVITPHQVIGQGFMYMRTDQPPFNVAAAHVDHVAGRAQRVEHHDRAGCGLRHPELARRPRCGARHQGEYLHRERAGDGLRPPGDRDPSHPAQHAPHDHRGGDHRTLDGDPDRGQPVIPGAGRAAAVPDVGRDALAGRSRPHVSGAVAGDLAGGRAVARRLRLQHARRRAARPARPAIERRVVLPAPALRTPLERL
jgi:Bacterial extracellular solute-binding proteins, family 5 Middle